MPKKLKLSKYFDNSFQKSYKKTKKHGKTYKMQIFVEKSQYSKIFDYGNYFHIFFFPILFYNLISFFKKSNINFNGIMTFKTKFSKEFFWKI